MLIGILFQEPCLYGFSSRNHAYMGSVQGTSRTEDLFQEPRLKGFSSMGSFPGTTLIGVLLQGFSSWNPAYSAGFSSRNHAYKGFVSGTHIGFDFWISSWLYRHMQFQCIICCVVRCWILTRDYQCGHQSTFLSVESVLNFSDLMITGITHLPPHPTNRSNANRLKSTCLEN